MTSAVAASNASSVAIDNDTEGLKSPSWAVCSPDPLEMENTGSMGEKKYVNENIAEDQNVDQDESGEGWSTVKGKGEKQEHRFSGNHYSRGHGGGRARSNRFHHKKKARYPPANPENNVSKRGKESEPVQDVTGGQASVNGTSAELQSGGESADSESRKSDGDKKENSPKEYVEAPVPKVNPWGKEKPSATKLPSKAPNNKGVKQEPKVKTPPKAKHVEKTSPAKLPATCAWGKTGNGQKEEVALKEKPVDNLPEDKPASKKNTKGFLMC